MTKVASTEAKVASQLTTYTMHLSWRPEPEHFKQTAFGRFFHGHSASANRPASMASRRVLGRYTPCSACSMRRFLPCTD